MGGAGHVARIGVVRKALENPEGKRSLGRPRLRLGNNIITDLEKKQCGLDVSGHWVVRMSTITNFVNLLISRVTISFSQTTMLHGVS
jgi:hypothetical protein